MGVSNCLLVEAPTIYGWSMVSHYIPQGIRRKVLERDKYRCQYCGSTSNLCIGHKTPRCRGGDNSLSNLEVICKDCSKKKGKLTRDEFLEQELNSSFKFEEKKEKTLEDLSVVIKSGKAKVFLQDNPYFEIIVEVYLLSNGWVHIVLDDGTEETYPSTQIRRIEWIEKINRRG